MFVIDDTARLWDRDMRNGGLGGGWSEMCVDGGGAIHRVLISPIFRVDAMFCPLLHKKCNFSSSHGRKCPYYGVPAFDAV
jgi:hypothetical protein